MNFKYLILLIFLYTYPSVSFGSCDLPQVLNSEFRIVKVTPAQLKCTFDHQGKRLKEIFAPASGCFIDLERTNSKNKMAHVKKGIYANSSVCQEVVGKVLKLEIQSPCCDEPLNWFRCKLSSKIEVINELPRSIDQFACVTDRWKLRTQ